MCSFIGFKCYPKNVKENFQPVWDLLKVKGGDETSFILMYNDFISRISSADIVNGMKKKEMFNKIDEETYDTHMQENILELVDNKLKNFNTDQLIQVIGFSRLTPEMEEQCNQLSQPYHNILENSIITVHGTIPHAEHIAKKYRININVDTELFNYLPFDIVCKEVEKVGGKISAICVKSGEPTKYYQNGLGLYQFKFTDVLIDTNIDCRNMKTQYDLKLQKEYRKNLEIYPTRIIALFSGGLDITCATQKAIENIRNSQNNLTEIHLWYFDWGTRASEYEKQVGKNVSARLYDMFEIKTEFKSIDVKNMFTNILSACDMTGTRLIDNNAEGAGSHEAEAAISYVPYRNTFLMTLAAARAEQLYPNEHIQFVIGANLSEGMIYLDNSETWLTQMNNLVKVGGQSCEKFEVIAPYVNRTKTEMVKDAISRGFFLDSYSCYFPNADGSPCGKCGSCILRNNALTRGNKEN